MKLFRLKTLLLATCFSALYNSASAQNFSFNCSRDTLVPGCPANLCINLKAIVPDIHGLTTSYSLNPGSFTAGCFPVYVAPDDPNGLPTNLFIDDRYSGVVNLSFNFPFYGTIYNSLVASTNGYVSFDVSLANGGSHYQNRGDLPNALYDRALIMGPYHDLDPSLNPGTNRIQYQEWGVAPARRWVLSFFNVALFNCASLVRNTHQIILYESTGIIEVKIYDKEICNAWQGGKAMVGIQDFTRLNGMTPPNRRMSDPPWGSVGMNETWRFVPNAGPSLLKRVELYDMSNNLLSTGTTAPLVSGSLEATFPNICAPAGASTSYVVRSVYEKIDDPAVEVFGLDTVRINRLNPMTSLANTTPASCGVSDGVINVTGTTGGTPPYEYSLDGIIWQSSPTFTGLAAGTYTVYVRDNGNTCNMTIPNVVIGVSGIISAAVTSTPTACFSATNGTITITSAGGTGPYTFSLDGGAPQNGVIPFTFNNVSAGAHTVIVNDLGTGCNSGPRAVNVTAGAGVSGTAASTPTACPGVNNGTITVTALTGTPPFTWSLDGGPFVAGASPYTFTGVGSGPHNVTIRDNFNCNILVPANVAFGNGVSGNATTTATSCPGQNNGSITITALTGVAPFTWSLDGGIPVPGASPFTFNGVSAGTHFITIRDANNCNILVPATVTAGVAPTATTSSTATACTGVNTGTIIINTASGTAPYTFSLDGGAPVSGALPYTFTSVSAGAHTIVVTDANGCATNPITENVAAGATPTATASSTATACSGVNNGTVIINTASGVAPYTFSLDGGAPVSGTLPYIFTGVAAGAHTIVVNDANGCSTNQIPVNVATGFGASGLGLVTGTSCPNVSNGSIEVTMVTGVPPFSYSLDGGAPVTGPSPYTFTGVAVGIHTVQITDNLGCQTQLTGLDVTAGAAFTANTAATATSCNTSNNGSITVTPNGGTAPFTYSLDGAAPVTGPSPYTFTGLTAGSHTIVVTESAGCITNSIPVTVPAGPSLTTTVNVSNVLCNGGNTGTITVTQPVVGTPPFEYSLDGTNWQLSNVFPNRTAGNYTVYYREANGCQNQQPVTITEPAQLAATNASIAATCNGAVDGTITVSATGGTAPYEYSIDGGVNWQPGNTFNGGAGPYTITIRDANGCLTTRGATITEPAILTASAVSVAGSCNGGNDGTITVTAIGGNNGGYQYSIDGGANWQSSNVFNVAPGTYNISVKDNLGCNVAIPPVTVSLSSNLTYTRMADATICEGSSIQLNLVSNGTVYDWRQGAGLSNTSIANPVASPTISTEYIVRSTLDRCFIEDTVFITVNPAPVPDAGATGFICYGQSHQLQASGGVQYKWTPATFLNNPNIANPTSSATQTTLYTLSILADNNGCPSLVTDTVSVDVTPPIKIYTYPADTIAYPGDQIRLKAVSAVPSANIYNWTPFVNLDNPFISDPVVTARNAGDSIIYKVTASSIAGCIGEAFVKFRVYKGPELYTPTAFTPNGDGLNDLFYPFPVGIKSINYFRVFNRWGQLIFSSNTLYKGWDGKFQGKDQASGVYVWMAQGVDKNNKLITRQGSITVIR
ncbi:MAG: gliding motility-associated C-terminal domain-containing protein [Chitinophagaceae bacterium]|nr:gliding motility-associated C-terminal domain-containing protein [Chitinophagaceae bacterium]